MIIFFVLYKVKSVLLLSYLNTLRRHTFQGKNEKNDEENLFIFIEEMSFDEKEKCEKSL